MEVSPSDIKKQLLKLNIFKSSGQDDVHPKLLKSLAYDKFKKDIKYDPLNYRPVSLTCILC